MWTFIEVAILEWNRIIVLQELPLRMLLFMNKSHKGMERKREVEIKLLIQE